MLLSANPTLRAAVTAIGVLRAGLVLVPANPGSTERELRHVIKATLPSACVADTRDATKALCDLDDSMIAVGATATSARTTDSGLDGAKPADVAIILFTSGTTGSPKGAAHTYASLAANCEALRVAWHWNEDDRLVHSLPIFHAHGLCVGLLGSLYAGGSVVLLPRFAVSPVLEAITAHKATMFFGVPTMYHRLASCGRAGELRSLRLAVSGSAALPATLHHSLATDFGVSVLERYGTTETLMALSNPYAGERRAGTVGLPLPGVEVRIEGAKGPGGELLVRSPACFEGYWGDEKATAAAVQDGWYRTGDLATVDSEGYYRILGRTTELVISGGFNVYPAEVEDVLARHPGVAEVAVTGTPSEEWGEVVTAWIVPAAPPAATRPQLATPPLGGEDQGALAESVKAYAAEQLAPYKRPRIVHIVPSLPRNILGKVVRNQLFTNG